MKPHTASNLCKICGGHERLERGQGRRCHGFTGTDGWIHCSQRESTGKLFRSEANTWAHREAGKCPCGETHSEEPVDIGHAKGARIVATYDYHDEHGRMIYQVVRKEPKTFLQRRPHPFREGEWSWHMSSCDDYRAKGKSCDCAMPAQRLTSYHMPEVIAAVAAGDRVWICEGEKDVEAMRAAGCVATCNAGGAGKWLPEFSRFLEGADVTIVEDKDEAGRAHSRKVFASLRALAKSVNVVQAAVGKDAADHLSGGKTTAEFIPVYPVSDLRDSDPVAWKRAVLARSLEVREQPIMRVDAEDALKQEPSPTWPTALDGLQTILRHFQGVTFLVGGPSAGKSWWAIGSAIRAAWAGWRVLYIAAEMSPAQILRRALAFTDGNPLPDGFDVLEAGYGASVERLVEIVSESIDARRTLIVLDSISSFVDQAEIAESGEDVHRIGPLKRLTMWALNVRRETNGEVSFLVLSERNAAGETKGRFGDHKADLVVSIKSDEKAPLGKRITVTKAWEQECGDLGLFALDPRTARLRRVGV